MRTTLNIRDELYRQVKMRAAEHGETVTSLVEQALERLLEEHAAPKREPFRLEPLGATGPFQLIPLRGGGAPLRDVDLHDNAAVRDLMDEGVPLEQMR